MNLLQFLQQRLEKALSGLVDKPEIYSRMVKTAQDPRFGDYQANCVMSLGKALGKPPREVAQAIVANLELGTELEAAEIAGPGFINLRLRSDWLAHQVRTIAKDARLGVDLVHPTKFVIDFSSPNVAKPMHVGHLRSTIIGDALVRLLRFMGHRVVSDNHLGDWGTQFGMILWGWKNHRSEQAYRADPVGELSRLYRLAQGQIKAGADHAGNLEKVKNLESQGKASEAEALFTKLFAKTCKTRQEIEDLVARGRAVDEAGRAETVKLHEGDPENRALWEQFIPHCLRALNKVYEQLDIHFDEQRGESAYQPMLADVVADLQKRGLAVESEGALVVFVPGMPAPCIVRKRDGAFNYATTDLATIRYRMETHQPDSILYLVDHRQGDHFKLFFDVARRWGFDRVHLEHLPFGTVMGDDGKPYKTRDGDVVGLESLLDEAVSRARQVIDANSPDLGAGERQQTAEVVGLGAVKYADLSQGRTSDYKFDWDKMMAMDGNTGTYMQYAYARTRSIFRKGGIDETTLRSAPPLPSLATPPERRLAFELLRFPEALSAAATEYKPNIITSYMWDVARAYSSFFENCPVLKAETPELRSSRLLLCDLTAQIIRQGLALLGIRTVERM
jgi:arginyl-tRNA synthetase